MPKRRGPRPSAAKERYWRAMVRRQARSGLGVREFCRAQQIGEASFYVWRRELRRRDAAAAEGRMSAVRAEKHPVCPREERGIAPPRFVPITVVAEDSARIGSEGVELIFPSGAVLRLPSETRPGRIAAVLSAWERRRC